jgi:hypothetical protein
MAKKAIDYSISGFVQTPTFRNIGGYKIFRDMIYGLPGVIFQADYRFYKERNLFDFPRNKISYRFLRLMFKSSNARKYFKKKIPKIFLSPYDKFFRKLNIDEEKINFGFGTN